MNRLALALDPQDNRPVAEPAELRLLLHRLNNQLGIILAHAELIEAKSREDTDRARAAQIVASVLDALGTAKELQLQLGSDA